MRASFSHDLNTGTMTNAESTSRPQGKPSLRYALITPARNEAENIERLIQSMVVQTVQPVKWVIVSDGSTDGTDAIVKKHAAQHAWIELERRPERQTERHFAAKVEAFNAGHARLKGVDYDLVGSMDADISFDADFFAFLLGKFAEDPKLGLGGAPFKEEGLEYDFRFSSAEHVSGALQLFRRECFEQIGGYVPIKGGGIDVIAVWSVRARGWHTRTYTEKFYRHHRKMGTAKDSLWRVKFKDGRKDYALGVHPLWEVFRTVYQMTKRPVLIGGMALGLGYVLSMVTRAERPIPDELMRFRRADQMARLKALLRKCAGLKAPRQDAMTGAGASRCI
jgi:glycosyltransferase involved in cell wall biosynthesis